MTVARGLAMAASPVFALMALYHLAGPDTAGLCSAARGLPIDGMALMYGLMSLFHAPAWLSTQPAAGAPPRV